MTRMWLPVQVGCLLVVLTGCPHEKYTITMALTEKGILRKLTVEAVERDSLPPGELRLLAEAYGTTAPQEKVKKYTFERTFAGGLPGDIGGSGSFFFAKTSLGSLALYREEFRGETRAHAPIEGAFKDLQRLARALILWLEGEFGEEKEFPLLASFIQKELLPAAKDLCVYVYLRGNAQRQYPLFHATPEALKKWELIANEDTGRIVNLVLNRGFIKGKELGGLIVGEDTSKAAFKLLRRNLIERAGLSPGGLVEKLVALLSDTQRLESSAMAYLRTTEEYRRALKRKREQGQDSEVKLEEVLAEYAKNLRSLFEMGLGAADDELQLRLSAQRKPFATNGEFDPEKKHIRWYFRIDPEREGNWRVPAFAFAAWATENEAEQKAHFGRIILKGEELSQYCLWCMSLSGEASGAWNRFLRGVKSKDDFQKKVAELSAEERRRFSRGISIIEAAFPKPKQSAQ